MDGPPQQVLSSFGLTGRPYRLAGGQGTSFRVEDLVLKPVDDVGETVWVSELLAGLVVEGLRVAEPVPAVDGSWVVDGWCATRWARGDSAPEGREVELLEVCDRVHGALSRSPRPTFIAARTHWWARADRMVWGEQPIFDAVAHDHHVRRLVGLVGPVRQPDQLVHDDLCGNVLFDAVLAPAVIDWSLYWRPAGYGRAVVIVDSLLWHQAPHTSARAETERPDGAQLLVRALLFRRIAFLLAAMERGDRGPWSERDGEVVDLIGALAGEA